MPRFARSCASWPTSLAGSAIGYRRLHILLRRESVMINRKKTQRIYRKRRPQATAASASAGLNCHGMRSSMPLLGWPWTIRVMTAVM